MNIHDLLERARTDLETVMKQNAAAAAEAAMKDAMAGAPGAHAFDAVGSRVRTVLYCERHDQDHADCDPDDLCTGVPVPTVSDPTGEAAVLNDPARHAHRRFLGLVGHIARSMDDLLCLVQEWQPGKAPTPEQRKQTEKANQRDCCELCARVDSFSPVHRSTFDLDGNLDSTYSVCRWCYDFIRKTGRPPTRDELRTHAKGKPVRIKVTERLRLGIRTGALDTVVEL